MTYANNVRMFIMFYVLYILIFSSTAFALDKLDEKLCVELVHYFDFYNVTSKNMRLQLRDRLRYEMILFLKSSAIASFGGYDSPQDSQSSDKDRRHLRRCLNSGETEYVDDPNFYLSYRDHVRVDTINHKEKDYYYRALYVQVEPTREEIRQAKLTQSQNFVDAIMLLLPKNFKETLTPSISALFDSIQYDRSDFGKALLICLFHRAKKDIFTSTEYINMDRMPRFLYQIRDSFERYQAPVGAFLVKARPIPRILPYKIYKKYAQVDFLEEDDLL